jgi:hypothetical protein
MYQDLGKDQPRGVQIKTAIKNVVSQEMQPPKRRQQRGSSPHGIGGRPNL